MENGEEKKENCKGIGGKCKLEGEKVRKWTEDFCAGKKSRKVLCPSWKYTPLMPLLTLFLPPHCPSKKILVSPVPATVQD